MVAFVIMFFLLSKCSWFAILCSFQVYSKVIHIYMYVCAYTKLREVKVFDTSHTMLRGRAKIQSQMLIGSKVRLLTHATKPYLIGCLEHFVPSGPSTKGQLRDKWSLTVARWKNMEAILPCLSLALVWVNIMNANICKPHAELPVSFLNPKGALQKILNFPNFQIFKYH